MQPSGSGMTVTVTPPQHMLHEVLATLSGIPGSLISPVPRPPETAATWKVCDESLARTLHPAEHDICDSLARVGFLVYSLARYVNGVRTYSQRAASDVYERALAHGIREEVSAYTKEILRLERQAATSTQRMPLALIQATVRPYRELFEVLYSVVGEMEGPRQTHVLDILFGRHQSGFDHVQRAFHRLYVRCYGVWVRQTSARMLYGQSLLANAPSSSVPKHVGDKTQESVRFIGDLLSMLAHDSSAMDRPGPERRPRIPGDMTDRHARLLHGLMVRCCDGAQFSDQACQSLSQYSQSFDSCVSTIRQDVMGWLWDEADISSSLRRCLASFRDYFLLARGDHAEQLIKQLDELLQRKQQQQQARDAEDRGKLRDRDLFGVLRSAAAATTSLPDDAWRHYSLTLHAPSEEAPGQSKSFVEDFLGYRIQLGYAMPWELALVLAASDIASYSRLWSFLLHFRRIHSGLQSVWMCVSNRHASGGGADRSVLGLRWMMLRFTDAWWSYLQIDVIERAYQCLLSRIFSSGEGFGHLDFATIRSIHSEFMGSLGSGSFIDSHVIRGAVYSALGCVERFSQLASRSSRIHSHSHGTRHVHALAKEFDGHRAFLVRTLSSMNRVGHSDDHIDRILLRLDLDHQLQ